MKKYKTLEHKGDLKVRVFGKTKEDLFTNAALAMENGLRPQIRNSKSAIRNISITSPDLNALLVDFLNEVLYFIQTNKEIYDKVNFIKFSSGELQAELSGQKVARFDKDIKAVTHHGLKIRRQKPGKWTATIIFDV